MARKKKSARSVGPADPPAPRDDARAADGAAGDESGRARVPVVGIGASAGGLDAFKRFFAKMPADSGLAFVLIPHLDPSHESLMVELIARHTAMPVAEAVEDGTVEANRVYIIPPNKYLTISGGSLRLTGPVERRSTRTSIDSFLRSLAEDLEDRAIGIVFSGTGAHGTLGLRAIKARGGMTMVQDAATAEYDQMPRSAVAAGVADYVLSPERMPEALTQYARHLFARAAPLAQSIVDSPDQLNQILSVLHARTRFDFRCYRKPMLARRVQRRMGLNHIEQVSDFLALLRDQPDELKNLAKDLMIGVTSFFRDREVFEALATQVLGPLVLAKDPDAAIRVWVPGCSTGEEAYTIAILVFEQLAAAQKRCPVQIFASDIDEDALEVGRQGVYPETIESDMTPERLARFFTRVDKSAFQVAKPLREAVIFACQNMLADPPFSKLDLVSCRNVLIYLEPDVQKKVIDLFHFALNEKGCLLLGPAETVGRQSDLFEPISKKWRLFRRRGQSRPDRVAFPVNAGEDRRVPGRRPADSTTPRLPGFAQLTQQLLLEEYAPAAVLINRQCEVLYYFGPTARYLDHPTGEPTSDLLRLVREGLRAKLRSAITRAGRDRQKVTVDELRVKRDGVYQAVNATVRPLPASGAGDDLLLVVLSDAPAPGRSLPAGPEPTEEPLVRQLEYELRVTREELQSTIEEMESSNEELKASNEEMMSMNEELQSANEELETSKEELQSLNEELTTVNAQLHEKVVELETANNDLANLLTSTEIATLFLDTEFRIRRFTPAATQLFNLIATDVGRPLADIAPKFRDDELLHDAETALRNLAPAAREVPAAGGAWYLRRTLPYRTTDNRIDGVVVTFADVTALKQATERLRRLATVLLDSNDAVTVHDFDGRITAWNRGAEKTYGYTEPEALRMNIAELEPQDRHEEVRAHMERLRAGDGGDSWETQRVCKDGRVLDVWLTVTILRDDAGDPVGVATTERDITARKRAERELRRAEEAARTQLAEVEAIYAGAPIGMTSLDANFRFVRVNEHFARMNGLVIHPGEMLVHPNELPALTGQFKQILTRVSETGRPVLETEIPVRTPPHGDADRVWLVSCYPVKGPDGRLQSVSAIVLDVTERKAIEKEIRALNDNLEERVAQRTAELKESNWALQEEMARRKQAQDTAARFAAIVESSDDAIVAKTLDGTVTNWNAAAEHIYGYTAEEMLGQSVFVMVPPDEREQLRTIHRRVEVGEFVEHLEVRRIRKDGQEIFVSLTNSPIRNDAGAIVGIAAIGRDITRQKVMERALRESQARLAAIVDTAGDGLITIDDRGTVQSFNRTAEKLFGYSAADVIGHNVNMLMPPPYHGAHDEYVANYLRTGVKKMIDSGREVVARRKDGSTFPIDLAVSEFNDGTRRLFTGLIRDISTRKLLEKEVLEVATQEQRRIGQDLHDSVGQELTGLGLVAETLADALTQQGHPDAPLADKIAAGTRRALSEVRAMSRGLIPVEVDAAGLSMALGELAARVREQSKVECTFTCTPRFRWDDNVAATHYYRIAQEAVANALRHGRATQIDIRLGAENGRVVLSVWNEGAAYRDDGATNSGLGLKIMRYRAGLIDAALNIGPAEQGGTIVTCTLIRGTDHEQD